jgi:hypothetical protein
MDEPSVVERLRAMLMSGRIPHGRPARIFGGPGSGAPCDACGDAIAAEDAEVEMDFPDGPTLLFHPRCFQVLESLRQEFLR